MKVYIAGPYTPSRSRNSTTPSRSPTASCGRPPCLPPALDDAVEPGRPETGGGLV